MVNIARPATASSDLRQGCQLYPGLYRHSSLRSLLRLQKAGRHPAGSAALETCDRKIAERRLKECIGNLEKVDAEVERTTHRRMLIAALRGCRHSWPEREQPCHRPVRHQDASWAWWPHGRDFEVRQVRPSMLDAVACSRGTPAAQRELQRLRQLSSGSCSTSRWGTASLRSLQQPKACGYLGRSPKRPSVIVPTEAQFQAIIDDIRSLPLSYPLMLDIRRRKVGRLP